MRHYFLNTEHNKEDFFTFEESFLNHHYKLNSCSDVFSKQKIDEGTKVLLNTIVKQVQLQGNVLDFGCGYGIIGMVLKHHFPSILITMIDVNKTAVELTKQNILQNGFLEKEVTVLESNLLQALSQDSMFDHVVTNPPIKVGKEVLFSAMKELHAHLKLNGTITLVIRKDHGMKSLKQQLKNLYGNCRILNRNEGYYVLHSVKEETQPNTKEDVLNVDVEDLNMLDSIDV